MSGALIAALFAQKLKQKTAQHAKQLEATERSADESTRLTKLELLEQQQERRKELEKEILEREEHLRQRENDQRDRDNNLNEKEARIITREEHQALSAKRLAEEMRRVKRYRDAYRHRLRKINNWTSQEAIEAWREELRTSEDELVKEIKREVLLESEQMYRHEAQRILIDTMQRITATPPNEISATLVQIPNEDMKGRLIGREGRNIRAIESATGVTLMIDETPGSMLVSSFDPVRREIARIALERLIKDGRIHPVSIEETVTQVRDELKDSVIELGERSLLKLRLHGVHPEIVSLLGKLHYRLSNNQNTLEHSIEVAYFCSLLASELGLDPDLAKRCGLFHDLGKAIDHDYEGSHASSAAMLLKRYGEDERVVNAVAASHDEVAPSSVYAGLLRVADSLSASRPGARANALEGYLQRVRSLEDLARDMDGVSEVYAVQAGKEIRIIVEPNRMDDQEARHLARTVRRRIEEELNYPGTIKVTVIREKRFVETAK
ncbi:ribonuclease Y [Cerasicoccus arenae]|uniref:Ribonuclease Y n=2 Tax=Cerasicoccus arenae TaxID=424488 RepID=A0A8J3DC45_9BACT|nr:ribonuclease Y [Cerasicoccus arenae]GHC08266.1 ribonuclease Y [Cerasicoccus arenae]